MRTYKRKLGSRPYRNYTDSHLKEALRLVLANKLSQREAAQRFNIHRNTLWLKIKEARGLPTVPGKSPGRQPVFTVEEENKFVAHAVAMSSYGFPLTAVDLRCMVRAYLDKTGRKVPFFQDGNFPGKDWAYSFMSRHKEILSQRMSKNISNGRAKTDKEGINTYFANLEKEVVGEVFMEELNRRSEEMIKGRVTKKRKLSNVPTGRSTSAADVEEAGGEEVASASGDSEEATTSRGCDEATATATATATGKGRKRTKRQVRCSPKSSKSARNKS